VSYHYHLTPFPDKYGRPVTVTKQGPGGKKQTYKTAYSNFTKIVTDPKGIRKQVVNNAIGQTLKIIDVYGSGKHGPSAPPGITNEFDTFGEDGSSSITYAYDAAGRLIKTTDAAGNELGKIRHLLTVRLSPGQ